MNAHFSKTLCDPAVERAFMESYYVRAAERHQEWSEQFHSMEATGRRIGIDCHAAVRELTRRIKKDLRSAEEAMRILARAESATWGRGQMVLEVAWESLEHKWNLWANVSQH